MVLVGLFGVVTSWGAYLKDAELESSGHRARGIVLEKTFLRAADGDSDHLVTYRFVAANGAPIVSQRGLSRTRWTALRVGAELEVIYSPDDPTRNFPTGAGATSIAGAAVLTIIFGSVAVLGAIVLFRWVRPAADAEGDA